jgi:hypothetical protein
MNKCLGFAGLLFGHKFEPRFSYGAPTIESVEGSGLFGVARLIEASKPATYHGEVCVRCGCRSTELLNGGRV